MERILRLRHEVARMVGFPSFAEYSLANKMAESVDEVRAFLEDLAARSLPAGRREMRELEASRAGGSRPGTSRTTRRSCGARATTSPTSSCGRISPSRACWPALFGRCGHLYGLRIARRAGVDVWHEDVRLYDVRDARDELRGSFYVDLYARPKKRSGAWMDECIGRARLNGGVELPVAYLCCNFTPPMAGAPALLAHDEVVTLFHELGHTLHHVLTRVDYPSVAGINGVPWDAVELPSQFMERLRVGAATCCRSSRRTTRRGEPLPAALLERLIAARRFNAGMQMLRQLEFALFDLRLHAEYAPGRGRSRRHGAERGALARLGRAGAGVQSLCARLHARLRRRDTRPATTATSGPRCSRPTPSPPSRRPACSTARPDSASCAASSRSAARVRSMEAFVDFRGRKPTLDALLRQCGLDG